MWDGITVEIKSWLNLHSDSCMFLLITGKSKFLKSISCPSATLFVSVCLCLVYMQLFESCDLVHMLPPHLLILLNLVYIA